MAENDLLTDEHRIRLFANALADDCDHFPVLKLFTPDAGATWLISEVDPDDPDWLLDFVISASAVPNWAMSASRRSSQ